MLATKSPAVLLLSDGYIFKGFHYGKSGTTFGEICFNTGMTGYQEVFTDPSYSGQVVVMNNVHIGNYGTKDSDVESNSVKIKGLICRNFEEQFSRIQSTKNIQEYLVENNIVVIDGVDTRALVAHIRTQGAMNCIISSEIFDEEKLKEELNNCPNMDGAELASTVSTKEAYELGNPNAAIKVSVLDFGIKSNILKCLVDRGVHVKIYPAKTSFNTLAEFNPTGYFLSNGPGDPASMPYAVETIKQILATNKPLFGICLGHQLLALANDVDTFKMHYGHRGLNHPVKNIITGQCEITSQNHGFGISAESVKANNNIEITHINLNDGSVEGIRLKDKLAFSVQYHPESSPGPHDSRYLFDDFVAMMAN
ncbi:MAG: glutamine-hydrolyzing carbamoyl-phosphate synthase small subunit [Chitinophagaceae bacterium]